MERTANIHALNCKHRPFIDHITCDYQVHLDRIICERNHFICDWAADIAHLSLDTHRWHEVDEYSKPEVRFDAGDLMSDQPVSSGADKSRKKAVPRWAVIGIFLLLAIHAIALAQSFLMPVVLGVILALVFSPVRRAMSRLKVPAGISAAAITLALVLAFLALVAGLTAPVQGWIDDAPAIARQLEWKLQEIRGAAEGVTKAAEQVEKLTEGVSNEKSGSSGPSQGGPGIAPTDTSADGPQHVIVDTPDKLTGAFMSVPTYIGQILFTLILMFFLLASGDLFYKKIVYVTPKLKDKKRAVLIAHEIERRLSRYLATITVINFGLGVVIGAAMWLVGMPNPLLFGTVAFVFNFVPYLGAVVGVGLCFIAGVVTFPTVQGAFGAAGLYMVLTAVEGQLITPYFVGRSLQLNTVVVFLAVTFWAWLWSVVGMLVALPLLVALRTISEHIPAMQAFGHFLSSANDPAPRPTDDLEEEPTTKTV